MNNISKEMAPTLLHAALLELATLECPARECPTLRPALLEAALLALNASALRHTPTAVAQQSHFWEKHHAWQG